MSFLTRRQGNRKNGNRYLAMAFVEAAHYATIWDPTIKRFYQRRQRRVRTIVVKKTVANKLARALLPHFDTAGAI